jgi:hypothetical protein
MAEKSAESSLELGNPIPSELHRSEIQMFRRIDFGSQIPPLSGLSDPLEDLEGSGYQGRVQADRHRARFQAENCSTVLAALVHRSHGIQ